MRRIILLAGLALAVGVLLPASAMPAAGGSDLPFRAAGSGTGTTNLATGQGELTIPVLATHFGLSTFEQHFQLVPTGPGTFNLVGTWRLTAANGDQMFGTQSGSVRFTDAIHTTSLVDYVSTGGTGRFADATLTFSGIVNGTRVSVEGMVATTFFEGTAVGQLSYR